MQRKDLTNFYQNAIYTQSYRFWNANPEYIYLKSLLTSSVPDNPNFEFETSYVNWDDIGLFCFSH